MVSNVDLELLAPLLEVAGEGTIGIGEQVIDYRVTPKFLGGDSEFSVPVLITGAWSNLKFRPDLDGLLNLRAQEAAKAAEQELKKAAEEEVKKLEDELKQSVEDKLKKSLGGLFGD